MDQAVRTIGYLTVTGYTRASTDDSDVRTEVDDEGYLRGEVFNPTTIVVAVDLGTYDMGFADRTEREGF